MGRAPFSSSPHQPPPPPLNPKICHVSARWMSSLLDSFDFEGLNWVYPSQAELEPGRPWLIASLVTPSTPSLCHSSAVFHSPSAWPASLSCVLGHSGAQAREGDWTKHHPPPQEVDPGASPAELMVGHQHHRGTGRDAWGSRSWIWFIQISTDATTLKHYTWTSVVPWIRIRLPTQGCGFNPWSGKIPHSLEQLNPHTTTTEPVHLEPVLCNKRSYHSEKSMHCNEE